MKPFQISCFLRILTLAIGCVLAGCVPKETLDQSFWQPPGKVQDPQTDAGLAALVKANHEDAARHFAAALTLNPENAYALLGSALAAERAGDTVRARHLYEKILDLRPVPHQSFKMPGKRVAGTIIGVTRYQLSMVDAKGKGNPQWASTTFGGSGDNQLEPGRQRLERGAAGNVLKRFDILGRLLSESLITPQEHSIRRRENIGALLPFTRKRPAAGLNRRVPKGDDIIGRLRSIGRAMAMGAMDPARHSHERELILDALLPAKPRTRGLPISPPGTARQLDAFVERLEAAKKAKLITPEEYDKERKAIYDAANGAPAERAAVSPPSPHQTGG